MYPDPPPFDPGKAFLNVRTDDPDTSHEAAKRIRETDRESVLAAYRAVYPNGLTTDEFVVQICPDLHMKRAESLRKRRSDLVRDGVLRDTGERRNGQAVYAWVTGRLF